MNQVCHFLLGLVFVPAPAGDFTASHAYGVEQVNLTLDSDPFIVHGLPEVVRKHTQLVCFILSDEIRENMCVHHWKPTLSFPDGLDVLKKLWITLRHL